MESPQTIVPDRWQAAKRIFRAGVDLPSRERSAFLDRECGDDQPLRRLVKRLLASDRRAANPENDPLPNLFAVDRPGWPVQPVSEETRPAGAREPSTGQIVSHYLILERLGTGGMGVIFHARDIHLKRDVVLKFLPPHLSQDALALRHLIVEAQAAAALDDPRISTVFEIGGIESGNLFIAETYWAGQTLEARLEEGPLPPAEALRIASEIAHGLAAAHSRDIIHRDIKPANILLTHDGEVKILDFGIAQTPDTTDSPQHGTTPGTQAYMAPEQIRGEAVDGRTDLWSLGTVLYLMLTGRLPFRGRSRDELTQAILTHDPEPLSTYLPRSSRRLDWLLRIALRKKPKARFQSAGAFLEAVQKVAPAIAAPARPTHPFLSSASRPSPRFVALAFSAVIVIALLLTAWVTVTDDRDVNAAHQKQIHSIAVLPFVNLSATPDQGPFVDGLTEALIDSLGRIRHLRVTSRTSSMIYRDSDKTLTEIADELNVEGVVEGSVTADGDSTHVVVRLIETDPEHQIWTGSYGRPRQDLFALQQELALAIAGEVHVAITPAEERHLRTPRQIDHQAQELFLKARHLSRLGYSQGRSIKAFDMLLEAVSLEPDFAEALAELANLYPLLAHFNVMKPDEAYPLSVAAALAALEQDPSLVSAHLALMRNNLTFAWNWESARRTILRGLQNRPDSGSLHRGYAWYLATTGQLERALIEIETAVRLDPVSETIAVDRARMLFYAARYPEAIGRCLEILDMWPNSVGAFRFLGLAQARMGQMDEGLAALRKAVDLGAAHPILLGELGATLAMAGERSDALEILTDLVAMQPTPSYEVAVLLSGLGDVGTALEWLERALQEHSILIPRLRIDPCMDSLREEPRFEALLNQIGLADTQIAAVSGAEGTHLEHLREPIGRPWSQGASTTSRVR